MSEMRRAFPMPAAAKTACHNHGAEGTEWRKQKRIHRLRFNINRNSLDRGMTLYVNLVDVLKWRIRMDGWMDDSKADVLRLHVAETQEGLETTIHCAKISEGDGPQSRNHAGWRQQRPRA